MNSMDQGTGKFMRKFSKDKAKIESISLRKNRWVPIAFILAVSCWIRCGSTQLDINIFLLNTEFFFDNLPPHGRIFGRNIPIPTKQRRNISRKKNLLDHILIIPSFQDEFLRIDKERRCQIFDVDLSNHRAMVVLLRFAN